MTSDKQNNGHLAKPFTPTLSAAFHRTSKSPLTPKLASPSPGYPAARRLAHSDLPYSTPTKDDIPSVPPTFLSANVTPRSGSRNTRRDAAFTSPSNIPTAHTSPASYSQPPVGLGVNGVRRTERSPARGTKPAEQSRSLRGKTLTAEGQQVSRSTSFMDMTSSSPMFFHASDARSTVSSDVEAPSRQRQGKMSPASSFIYANGDQERQTSTEDFHSTVSSVKLRSGGLPRPIPLSRPAASPSPRLKSPRASDAASHPSDDALSQHGPNPDLNLVESIVQRYSSSPSGISERSQLYSLRPHRKSSSMDSNNQPLSPPEGLRASPIIISNNPDTNGATPTLSDHIPPLRPRVFSNGSSVCASPHMAMPLSPGKSEGPSDAAVNARTERKIMDLEISNSSLLAINRTLEREMRKQNAELRRYRRLSRSGRLSMALSTRSFSGAALSTTSEMEEENSELSLSQDEFSDSSDEDSVPDEGVLSPDSLAEHDAKLRAQDEKRFLVDLARHQELLIDSQKLNQSLKRCLGWTEELIKEGRKALEYNVHVQDVELGGRVLSPEELGDVGESGRALLSPSTEFNSTFHQDNPALDDSYFDPATFPLPSSPGGTD